MRPRYEDYTITRISYNDIYDRYVIIAESAFGNRMQWWQKNEPTYKAGDIFAIRYDLEAN